jgi:RND family efflux transporter MFP subunit
MKYSISIAALTLTLFGQAVLAGDLITLTDKQRQSLGITTSPLPNKQSGEVAGLPAQVVIPSGQLFVVSTPLPAMIEQTLVGVGDSVKKGQVLARLQSAAVSEAQRGLLQASVQNQLAQQNLIRDESLWNDGIISESRYRATQGMATETKAALSERKQMLRIAGMSDGAIAQIQSGKNINSLLTVTAPIDGVILEKSAEAGQRLDAATAIFKIAKLDPLALEVQAPVALARDIKSGAAIQISAYSASGKVTAVGRSLSGSNQTVLVRALILHGSDNLRAGQFVEATIETGSNGMSQWNIPNSAIARLAGRAVVYVANEKGFRTQSVTVVSEGAQSSVITGQLKGDERIAVQGVSALKSASMGIGGGE